MTIYARQFSFIVDPSSRAELEKITDGIYNITRKQQGFVSSSYLGNMETGECIGLTLWESKDVADAFFAELVPSVQETLGKLFKAPPTSQWYEVYEPKE